jgi:hypothetical protein
MEKWTEVRRKVLVQKVSERQIRKDYRVSAATLDKILTNSEPRGYRQLVARPKPKLGDFLGVIDQILEDDVHALTRLSIRDWVKARRAWLTSTSQRPFSTRTIRCFGFLRSQLR